MEQQSANPGAGKGMMLTGLILGILSIVGYWVIGFIIAASILGGGKPMIIAYIWTAVCLIAPLLSFMGMSQAGKAGSPKGLGIGGLICGVVGLALSVWLIMQTHTAMAAVDVLKGAGDSLMDALKSLGDTAAH